MRHLCLRKYLLEKRGSIYQLGHSATLIMSSIGEDGESSVNNHLLQSSLWCESSMLVPMSTKGVARVRGKAVTFDRATLNRFYGLEDIECNEYSTYVDDHVDLNEIVNTICKLGT